MIGDRVEDTEGVERPAHFPGVIVEANAGGGDDDTVDEGVGPNCIAGLLEELAAAPVVVVPTPRTRR